MYAADTIAAIATPPGAGGIGVVRVSGPLASEIAGRVLVTKSPTAWQTHRFYHGTVVDPSGDSLDEALAVIMHAPHSYTGEDVLELHCHGSPVGLRRVLATVLAHGARLAQPGEFTRRAFLNGRLDLSQAEAVAELIQARTDSGARAAASQLFGRLSETLEQIRARLIDLRARLEVQIDFSEEDVVVDQEHLADDLEDALVRVRQLLGSYTHGRLIRDGLRVVIAGKPNVGKSSLLNALLQAERAIVTATPGTTRDVVEDWADFNGVPVVLSDTAGLRETSDPIETIGVGRARAKIDDADVVVAVFDASRPIDSQDEPVIEALAGRRSVIVLNKDDLPRASDHVVPDSLLGTRVRVSALLATGLDELRAAVVDCVSGERDQPTDTPTVTLERHRDALEKTRASLELALTSVRQRVPPELIAVDLQNAADHLGGITGVITSEDVLDRIFSKFCIGK